MTWYRIENDGGAESQITGEDAIRLMERRTGKGKAQLTLAEMIQQAEGHPSYISAAVSCGFASLQYRASRQ